MSDVFIQEVGLRDGIQIEPKILPLEKKVLWTNQLLSSGLRFIQAGSFVHPIKVPQMADTDELFRLLKSNPLLPKNTILSGLVLNEKGLDRGLACGVDLFCMGVSASNTHSLKNTGKSTDDALETILNMANRARAEGKPIQLSAQSAFGCNYEGQIHDDRVTHIIQKYIENGFTHISLADTSGMGTPFQVKLMYDKVQQLSADVTWGCHFHEAKGYGLANCFAAIQSGATFIESSFGGLGGCPFTAQASGNVCTEDLLEMLPKNKIAGEIDSTKIAQLSLQAESFFGKNLPGFFYKTLKDAV
jgi:hydroxymethylglutaryl-CoA lyase